MKKILHDYEALNEKENLMNYCKECDVDIRSIPHSKMKNIVTNRLYICGELNDLEKLVFITIYDLKAQQKYLPWVNITQERLAQILCKSKSSISKALNNLSKYNLIFKRKDRFWDKILIPNENIDDWGVAIDTDKLSLMEEKRKHTASSNKQLETEYKNYSFP